jgi:hypothetical protein
MKKLIRLTWKAALYEARKLRRTLQYGDFIAALNVADRIKILPEYSSMTQEEIIEASPNLTKCQKLIGVEQGFKNAENMYHWLRNNAQHSKYIEVFPYKFSKNDKVMSLSR